MKSFNGLKELFISNPLAAIEECQKIICFVTGYRSFKDFYSFHQEHRHISTCQKEWVHDQLAVHCFTCATDINSCICIECFLKGNHQGHEIEVRPDVIGNCDCGDFSLWKRSGFCSEHRGIEDDEHPELYLDEKLRITLTDVIFKSIFSSLKELRKSSDDKISTILEFASTFLKLGDGFRRLISISLTEKCDFEYLMNNIFDSSVEFNEFFQNFCGGLINDSIFRDNFSKICYKLLTEKTLQKDIDCIVSDIDKSNYEIWDSFWFHCFTKNPIENNIVRFNFDWVSCLIDFTSILKKAIGLVGYFNGELPDYFVCFLDMAKFCFEMQPNEQIQRFFDVLFTKILNCGSEEGKNDTIIVTSPLDQLEKGYFYFPHEIQIMFIWLITYFGSKNNLKIDKLIEELDKTIDISKIFYLNKNSVGQSFDNENDKFISRFLKQNENEQPLNDLHFGSFHNGASFFLTFPLYDALVSLFRIDNLTRVKIGRFLSLEKYQSLRIQLGIVTLKKILSFICYHQSLAIGVNFAIRNLLSKLNQKCNMNINLPFYLPLFQMIIGLQCKDENVIDEFSIKEFFAFEMAREIGLFDDFTSKFYENEDINEKQTQMFFSVLYFSLLIVIERTLFNYDSCKFIEEQIILGLKQESSNLAAFDDMYDSDADLFSNNTQYINSIIDKVAKNRNSDRKESNDEKDPTFYLKDDVEWKTISALNLFNNQKVILNNEISKHPDKLIKIQDFEPEETYFFKQDKDYSIDSNGLNIRLKEFLLTPSILAIVYYTLNSPKSELNDHLAMNILILASKFANEIESSSLPPFNESNTIKYDSSLPDLISNFKKVIFGFKIDRNGKATITNTLNKKTFISFLKIKISSNNQQQKSFIDILLQKGEIGKSVLNKMSIDLSDPSSQKNKTNINEIKKNQAKKLKENIMNQFKSAINDFDLNDIDSDDENQSVNNNDDLCSICSIKNKDEILFYPLYIYRTKFPFIIDKPPLIKTSSLDDVSVCDDADDYFDDFPNYKKYLNEKNEEEEEAIPSLMEIIDEFYNRAGESASHEELDQLYNEAFDEYSKIAQRIHRKNKIKILKKRIHQKEVEKRCTFGNNFVIQFGICQHHVHPYCLEKMEFKCPIDRSYKNGFLPNIDSVPKEKYINIFLEKIKGPINTFISNFFQFFDKRFISRINLLIEFVKSISGLISTYEVRLRNLPGCLDSNKTKLLSRNLFLTAYYAYRIFIKNSATFDEKTNIEIDSKLTIFQKFIKTLIENDEIEKCHDKNKKFKEIVSSFIKSHNVSSSTKLKRKDKEMFLFFKRVCLSEYFLLSNNVSEDNKASKFIDWDEILSISNLSNRYKIRFLNLKNNEFEFKSFFFTKLPQEYLRFAISPYNFPIVKTTEIHLFNILDYNYLIKNYDDFEETENQIKQKEEMKNYQKNIISYESYDDFSDKFPFYFSFKIFPSIFIFVGKSATRVITIDGRKVANLKPFYVNSYNSSDIGFQRNRPLFLNEERYMRVIDEILSGDFSNYLISFDEFS